MDNFFHKYKSWLGIAALIFVCNGQLSAQKQNNNWYFGSRAGVTFNTSPPSALTNGQLTTTAGCATASNDAGQLLFYTDGIKVYDANHVTIASNLQGTNLADQAAHIIPFVNDPTKFYITTTVSTGTPLPHGGVSYAVLSGASPTGGGTVGPSINITGLNGTVIEKQEVIPNASYTGYWLILKTTGSTTGTPPSTPQSQYLVYKVDDSGFTLNRTFTSTVNHSSVGYLRANQIGDMIVSTNQGNPSNTQDQLTELVRFDRTTGIISNPLKIQQRGTYGAEFSPSGQYLYLTGTDQVTGVESILQYDVSTYAATTINNSKTTVGPVGFASAGGLQLAPNLKIYVSGAMVVGSPSYNYINIINFPDRQGSAANYSSGVFSGAIILNGRPQGTYDSSDAPLAQLGLPHPLPRKKSLQTFTIVQECDTGFKYSLKVYTDTKTAEYYRVTLNGKSTVTFTDSTQISSGPLHGQLVVGKSYSLVIIDRFGDTLGTYNGKPNCGYIIGGGDYYTCDNFLFDDNNGSDGNYSPSQNYSTKVCSNNGGRVRLTFEFLDIAAGNGGNGDIFTISDALSGTNFYNSVGSYPLIKPTIVTSDPSSSCLLIEFTSNQTVEQRGWKAKVSCLPVVLPPCDSSVCKTQIPDDCSTACNLVLTSPGDCDNNPNGITQNSFCLTNIGATPSTPYINQSDCQPNNGITALPASDVWFKFTAVSNSLQVSIDNSGIQNPSLVLYQGSCGTLIGKDCSIGSTGNLFAEFFNLVVGQVYYIQIAGGTINDRGNFQLTFKNYNRCTRCGIVTELTASPAPVNGRYSPGDVVTFRFKITYWDPVASDNWVHSVIPEFGSGWDMSSLTYVLPKACNGTGVFESTRKTYDGCNFFC